MADTYERLIALLDGQGARYRLIDHAPEGRTELASELRGHPLAAAAKNLVIMVKLTKKTTRYVLAVVPGDAKVDMTAVRDLHGGKHASFAPVSKAEALAGSASGTILPLSFHPDLELVVDPGVVAHAEIFFNAARLDRSVALATDDYLRLANPRLAPVAA
jgi:Ala-tRNA(Pro) deacylase